jgi:hypothetical protein
VYVAAVVRWVSNFEKFQQIIYQPSHQLNKVQHKPCQSFYTQSQQQINTFPAHHHHHLYLPKAPIDQQVPDHPKNVKGLYQKIQIHLF